MFSLGRFGVVAFAAAVIFALFVGVILRTITGSRMTPGDRVKVVLGAIVVAAFAYSFYEPYRPEVVSVTVPAPKLGPGRKIRVVQLSDLHSGARIRLENDLPGIVRGLEPDLIVFTGDAVNENGGIEPFRRMMNSLAQIAPTYAVRGNLDVWWFPHARLFEDTGVRELKAEAVPVHVKGAEIWIAGIPVDSEHKAAAVFARVPKDKVLLFLHHYPWAATIAASHGADLHLGGDTHGGQARLPFLGELIRIRRHGVWRPVGLGREGATWVYVNRGIGMEGGTYMPRVRFGARPEITLIEVSPAQAAASRNSPNATRPVSRASE
jgi:predicted MPP superfamily phosphohydrolase